MTSFLVLALAAAFAGLVLTGAVRDLISYRIPNWIPFAILGLFPVAGLAAGLSLPTFGMHAAIGAAVLVAAMGMFAMNWVGGGDAKMFAAVAFWMGWPAVMDFLLWTAISGGVLAVGLLSLRSPALRPVILGGPPWLAKLSEPGGASPYGVAIAFGALMALPESPLLTTLAL